MKGLRRAEECQYDVVQGRAIVIDADGRELITLNAVGTLVWHALDGEHDEESIAADIAALFPTVPRQRIDEDIRAFLEELEALHLIAGCRR